MRHLAFSAGISYCSYERRVPSQFGCIGLNLFFTRDRCFEWKSPTALKFSTAIRRNRTEQKKKIPDKDFQGLAFDCDAFLHHRQYSTKPTSGEESEFPLAFSILMYEDVEEFERLLRAIYRPQNYYCVHVDAKSNQTIRRSVGAIANCFENVFLAQKTIGIRWGFFSVLEADLNCMEELLKYKQWKYFINLTGKEWPLKTNLELVKILKAINGANIAEGTIKGFVSNICEDLSFILVRFACKHISNQHSYPNTR